MTTDTRPWWVYVLLCRDGRTYTGMALNVEARYEAHLSGRGSLFTRINKPVCIVGARQFNTRTEAHREELALKKAGRYWVRRWCRTNPYTQLSSS
ncbi:GIY-YIG nuclease family protein [Zhongshania aquatica]|uniref:GIY-YIG nuclease family protein n=1 Tax=Zhongshania aquatica TaxID=2965069 RepID=UPI003313072B